MNTLQRIFILILLSLSFSSYGESPAKPATSTEPVKIEVYRSPSCGCCGKWVAHLQENNFQVIDKITNDVQAIKTKYGVPAEMASCHTAIVNGFIIEGHVPANDIRKLLKLKPQVIGIAVPAMPVGTPGMEMADKKDTYDVVSFSRNKPSEVFSHYEAKP